MFSFVYKNIDFAHKLDKPSSPTEEYYKHIHSFYEILYFVTGKVTYTVESESRPLCEGDIVFIPPGKYHFAAVDLSASYERYVLKLPESAVPDFVGKKLVSRSSFYGNSKKFGALFNSLDSYIGQYTDEETYTLFVADASKLMVMLCHETPHSGGKHNKLINALIDYVDANIYKPINTQMLADEFHYSKSFINIEFKKQMKIPIMQYVRSKKIMAAHQMILGGAKKSDVAEMFGFETYSTFYRAYKQLIVDSGSEIV